jgi:hypothetical protein
MPGLFVSSKAQLIGAQGKVKFPAGAAGAEAGKSQQPGFDLSLAGYKSALRRRSNDAGLTFLPNTLFQKLKRAEGSTLAFLQMAFSLR